MGELKGFADALWIGGVNSLLEPGALQQGEYQWGVNTTNRGGLISTRPGFALVGQAPWGLGEPQAMTVFTPRGKAAQIILAIGGKIYYSDDPFETWTTIQGLEFHPSSPINFCTGIKSVEMQEDQSLKIVDSYPVLIIQDGLHRAGLWNGTTARHMNPAPTPEASETPIGLWMAWSGNRLWVSQGSRLYASDIADPVKFTETHFLAEGGYFNLPDTITGIGQTQDLRTLLVGTESTMTTFLSNIRERTEWAGTPDFQKVLLPGIGVASGKSFINQYGLTWWFANGGVIGLDSAQQTYRSSRIHFRDQNLMRSKANLSNDLSVIAAGSFENFLFFSVPSGDIYNSHTWALDQAPIDTLDTPGNPAWSGVWTGIRPIEWVTAQIEGKTRCFCFSKDHVPGSIRGESTYNVWEAFVPQRHDVNHNRKVQRIKCMFETKRLQQDAMLKAFAYAKLDLTEIMGTVDLKVYYAGMRGGYQEILSKRIVATNGSIGAFDKRIKLDTRIENYRPQDRLLWTEQVAGGTDSQNGCDIETTYNRNIDRAFSLMVVWEGQMAVRAVQLFVEMMADETVGKCEPDENTERAITGASVGIDSNVVVTNHPAMGDSQSSYVRVITPRAQEFFYNSLIDMGRQVYPLDTSKQFVAPTIPRAPTPNLALWIDPPVPPPDPDPPPPTYPPDKNPPNADPQPVDAHPPKGVPLRKQPL